MSSNLLVQPNFRKGCVIFASRPLSLIVALILAVVICVVSFLLLTFPAITGYYYAVRESRNEDYFIDLNNIFRTAFLVFTGIRKYFIQSYIFGLFGLCPALVHFLAPIIPLYIKSGNQELYLSLILQLLWLPAFFLSGAIILYGYPCLIATNNFIDSIRYAFSAGKAKILKVMTVGFVLLFPVPAVVFHLLMVFTYPLIVAWAVSPMVDTTKSLIELKWKEREETSTGFFLPLCLLVVSAIGGYLSFRVWKGPGIIGWVGICLAFLILKIFTNWNFAFKLFGFALSYVAVLFGGGILFTRLWGEETFLIWIGICLVFLILFQKRIADRISSSRKPPR